MRISIADARRIALGAQGFGAFDRPVSRVDVRHLRKIIDRVQAFQLDSVNVAVRAHYMPLFSRIGPYRRSLIDEVAYQRRELFEYWGHQASLNAMGTFPLFGFRRVSARPWGSMKRILAEHPEYVEDIFLEIADRGPLSIGDLTDGGGRTGPWWGYSDGKHALEWLFVKGRLSIAKRNNFTRYYDLTERVIPTDVLAAPEPDQEESYRWLLRIGARALGIATADDLAKYFELNNPKARPRLKELVEEGELLEVEVEGWDKPGYLDATAARPRRLKATALFSPFDSMMWYRPRIERLWGFHYRIEIYVPEPKREFGYYVYPFMVDNELVGRVDLKADRKGGRLLAQGVFAEEGVDHETVAGRLADELRLMASWLELNDVVVGRRGNLANSLERAFRP